MRNRYRGNGDRGHFTAIAFGLAALGAAWSMAPASADAARTLPIEPTAREVVTGERRDISAEALLAWRRIDEASALDRDAALLSGEEFLSAVNRDLRTLDEKFAEAPAPAKREWAKRQLVLDAARDDFSMMVDGLREDHGASWPSVKDRMEDAYRTLADGIPDAWEELG